MYGVERYVVGWGGYISAVGVEPNKGFLVWVRFLVYVCGICYPFVTIVLRLVFLGVFVVHEWQKHDIHI